MTIVKHGQRIEILDGFRFLAILSVILYHYYSLYTPPFSTTSAYPYGSRFNYFTYGYLGVQFFFMISGFVIAYTLTTTSVMGEFWKKRFIRLFPAMFICSLIVLIVFRTLDKDYFFPRCHSIVNFFYSLTFVNLAFPDQILKHFGITGTTISGSHWSLWPEVQFYLFASLLYFSNPQKFFTRFFFSSVALYVFTKLIHFLALGGMPETHAFYGVLKNVFKLCMIFSYSILVIWFLAGVVFYRLYIGHRDKLTLFAFALIPILQWWECDNYKILSAALLMDLLFLLLIFYPQTLKPLRWKFITAIGMSSYSLYLIHENIGLFMINKLGPYFGDFSFLFPLLVLLLFIGFSLLLYTYFEKPLVKRFKKSIKKPVSVVS